MCSPFRKFAFVCVTALLIPVLPAAGQKRELRVCADPDNMPFSNMRQEGFENRIADVVAKDLNANLNYIWQRMGRGFVREYLNKARCDVLIGIPANYGPVLTTTPYYRSTYVFVTRKNAGPKVTSFDSPELRGLKIGVQVLDEEYTPPGRALARRGLQNTVVGFDTVGQNAGSIIRAVRTHQVDLAVVWGPLAGYFVRQQGNDLAITSVEPEVDPPGLPFTFAISMGVRKGNVGLRDELEKVLANRKGEIREILNEYGVPELPMAAANTAMNVPN
jgi:mxaJ protein